ncbi:MAG TPA: tetratricopeptide repeat protein [Candidatus Megaira endosymbiont of Nemacystus decipiens]|nr:tetratricopeptide repeat protein [Candidatus Megaera endosymbiont of Nemacystus decipiens]
MAKLFEEKITKLRNSLFPNDHLVSGQDLIEDNLVQIHSLADEISGSDSSSKLELLTTLDKELYKNLIVKLIHQRTDNIENLRCVLFKDLGSLYTQIGDLQKESANLNQGLKCYTDAAIFYQHSLHAMSRGYIKDQDTEIYQQLESIQQKILLSINGDSSIKFNDFNSESVKNCSQAKKEFLIKLRGNTKIKLDKFKTCYSKEEYNNSIQKLFTEITGDMRGLLKSLYEEADKELQQKLGLETPCEYTIVGLGSMALNQITPYSDLEFAIIIEKFTPEIVQYFRNLSHLVHFKCINIGETIIPTSKYGIDMSSLGKQGVNFDLGGKTPLGRINGDKVYDLIGTVEHLMNYVKSTSSTDKSLPFILENICLVKGSKSLVNEYKNAMQVFLKETYSGCEKKYQNKGLKNHQVKALKVLTEEIKEFDYKDPSKIATYKSDLAKLTPIFKTDDEGSLLDIKQEIYRLPDRMIYDLGMYFGIIGNSAWDTVNQLLKNEIISEIGSQNLKNAISFATSLRLKSYDQSASQTGMISTYIPALEHLKEEEKDKIVKTMFHIDDRKDLYDFFYVMMDFVDIIYFIAFPELQLQEQAPCILKKSNLFDDSNYLKAKVHAKFLDYDKALMYFKEVVKKCPDVLSLHEDLYTLCRKTCEIDEGLKTAENILVLNKKKYQNKINHPDIADSYNNLGAIYTDKGAYDLALTHNQKALEIKLKSYADTPNHPDIAVSHNNLGVLYSRKGAYDLAIDQHQKALEIRFKAYASNPNHPSIAGSYNSLGNVYESKGAYDLAIDQHQKALEIKLKAYTSIPNHLDIATSHNNLGSVYESKGAYNLAIEHYQKALEIMLKAHETSPNHPSIAAGYNNLGLVYANKGLYDLAIEHHQKALDIRLKAHETSPNHPDIAASYNNLGLVYANKGLYDLAIENYQKSLEINHKAYASSPNHPAIADSDTNLGIVYDERG